MADSATRLWCHNASVLFQQTTTNTMNDVNTLAGTRPIEAVSAGEGDGRI